MTERREPEDEPAPQGVNPGYAGFQLAKALATSTDHDDPATRARAETRIARWRTVLANILSGSVAYGSRTPVADLPAWVTLDVITGGFATGAALAGGPLQDHENARLANLYWGHIPAGDERRALNAWHLTDAGVAEALDRLQSGRYDIAVPEEAATLVIAWLAANGEAEAARQLLDTLSPHLATLRFYPIPRETPRQFDSRVHVASVGDVLKALGTVTPSARILTQKAAVEVWAPLHDRIVSLFLETVRDGWPCRHYPEGWAARALALSNEYIQLKRVHRLGGKHDHPQGHQAVLRSFLVRCATDPGSLSGRDVGRIRSILDKYVAKRGAPNTAEHARARRRQVADVDVPLFDAIAMVMTQRLEQAAPRDKGIDEGVDDLASIERAIGEPEAAAFAIAPGTPIPRLFRRKIARTLRATIDVLVERGVITSGETLARVLPQATAALAAGSLGDPALRQLYASIYRAFRRRRSLLLLNLEKQVTIDELPWVAAIDRFRSDNVSARASSRDTLADLTCLTLTAFPDAILPNKLLQELGMLADDAGLDIPLVEEIAVDIFMGRFTSKFVEAAHRAADLLDGSLYARYYGIDYDAIRALPVEKPAKQPAKQAAQQPVGKPAPPKPDPFADLCAARAGVKPGGRRRTVTNGMIIEQEQILTTHNLAVLFAALDLKDRLRDRLMDMARHCFTFICKRQQMKIDVHHARLIVVKNTAYAWRQMIFYLSLLSAAEIDEFQVWAEAHLGEASASFRHRFRPAMLGLAHAAAGRSLDTESAASAGVRRFLGWTDTPHWLLTDDR
jgi:hypothetical protein